MGARPGKGAGAELGCVKGLGAGCGAGAPTPSGALAGTAAMYTAVSGGKTAMGGAGASAGAGAARGIAGGGELPAYGVPRRGNATTGAPRQSFHASVASGGTGGLPWNVVSNTARFTSLPGGMRSSDERTRSSCLCMSMAAAASLDPGGTAYTYSR